MVQKGTLGCFNIAAMERIDQSSYVEALRGERLEVYFEVSAQRRGTLRVALEAIYEPDFVPRRSRKHNRFQP